MTATPPPTARAWAELVLLALIWGGSFPAIRLALEGFGVLTTVGLRVAGAALVLWLVVALRRLPVPRDPRIWGAFLLMGLLSNALPFTLITWGEVHIPSGLASILNAATAMFSVLVAAAVFADERLSLRKLAGVALGVIGVAVAIGLDVLSGLDLTAVSQLAVLGAAFSYACANAFGRAKLHGLTPQVAAAGMLTASSLEMLPLALWHEGMPPLAHPVAVWGALVYLALVATAGAYLLYYRILTVAGAGNTGLVTLLIVPFAILLGVAILGESLQPSAYLGFALIALGLVVLDGRVLRAWQRR